MKEATVTLRHKKKNKTIIVSLKEWSEDLGRFKYSAYERVGESHNDDESAKLHVTTQDDKFSESKLALLIEFINNAEGNIHIAFQPNADDSAPNLFLIHMTEVDDEGERITIAIESLLEGNIRQNDYEVINGFAKQLHADMRVNFNDSELSTTELIDLMHNIGEGVINKPIEEDEVHKLMNPDSEGAGTTEGGGDAPEESESTEESENTVAGSDDSGDPVTHIPLDFKGDTESPDEPAIASGAEGVGSLDTPNENTRLEDDAEIGKEKPAATSKPAKKKKASKKKTAKKTS